MAEDWAAIAADVASALGEFEQITLHEPPVDGVYDPMTDSTTGAGPEREHIGSGVEDTYSAFSIAQGLVLSKDVKFLLSPRKVDGQVMPLPVADQWTATLRGKAFAIKKVKSTQPAGVPVLIEMQLRS